MLFEAWSGPADTVSFTQVALAARQLRTTSTETHLQFTAEAMLAVLEDFDTPENQRCENSPPDALAALCALPSMPWCWGVSRGDYTPSAKACCSRELPLGVSSSKSRLFCRLDKARFRRFVDQLTEALEKPSNIVLEFLMLGAVEVRPASRAASGRLQVRYLFP